MNFRSFFRTILAGGLAVTGLVAAAETGFYTPKQDLPGLDAKGTKVEGRPNVLILGDSISIGYTRQVIQLLKDEANVSRPKANCGDTIIGLKNIDSWLGDKKWDVIHFNWGLWDLCYRNPASKEQGNRDKVNGTLSVPPDQYRKNLEELVTRLEKTGARLIWASTTKVPEGEVGRFIGDDVKYNAVAAEVMAKHGIPVNDLHALTAAFPPDHFTKPGDVHYTPAAYGKLAAQVAEAIRRHGLAGKSP